MLKRKMLLGLLLLIILPSISSANLSFNQAVLKRIDSLIKIYGKYMIVGEIVGIDKSGFTINIDNTFQPSPYANGVDSKYIDAYTIHYDMEIHNISIKELERRLPERKKWEDNQRLIEEVNEKKRAEKRQLAEQLKREAIKEKKVKLEQLEAEKKSAELNKYKSQEFNPERLETIRSMKGISDKDLLTFCVSGCSSQFPRDSMDWKRCIYSCATGNP